VPLTAPPRAEVARRKGERTREAILERAAALATQAGLEQLSIGALADELGMSKSGLFAHFGSKEDLQLATIEHARDVFVAEVVAPALLAAEGRARLAALLQGWLSYARRRVFPGGCFFAATSAEYAGRAGPVRQRLVELTGQWLALIERSTRAAVRSGELEADDPTQLAFELYALTQQANWNYQLFGDGRVFDRAEAAIEARLSPPQRAGSRSAR
jgi:AcrR family transcriptional regulator